MTLHLEYHWLMSALAGLLALWGASLLAVRFWTRRQMTKALLVAEDQDPVPIALPDPHPADQTALEVIRSYRRRYLLKWRPGTPISFRAINELSLNLVKEIAGIYYPEEDRPELKASLADLLALHNRVGARLAAWLDTGPMRPLKGVELATVLRYHELYQNLKNHWGYTFIKKHHVDKLVQWGWNAINFANPWYWGRKAAYHGGKEVAVRLLMARIADLVGEEAIRLYGRRGRGVKGKGRIQAVADHAAASPSRH